MGVRQFTQIRVFLEAAMENELQHTCAFLLTVYALLPLPLSQFLGKYVRD